jgi:hypothetical protein
MPLSTIFQLYCGGQFYWWRKTDCHDMTEILLKVVLNAINLNLEYEFRRE